MPRVSVMIPTFNCARFLGQAINSVLSQTYTDYEIIVVDDGSTDETQDVVAPFGRKIRYLHQPNTGLSSARNRALSQASGEFIAYVDADDMWYPHKLDKQVAFLDAQKGYGLVHSDFTVIDETDRAIHLQYYQETRRKVQQGHCTLDLLRSCHIQIPTVLERRDCIERAGRFDQRLAACQDYLHWILVSMEGIAFGYIDEPLTMYRWREDSLFRSSSMRVAEDFRTIFNILLDEKSLGMRFGREAADTIRERLYTVGRELAYAHRMEGQPACSMRYLSGLIWKFPSRIALYVDLLKACVPSTLAAKLRMLKAQL